MNLRFSERRDGDFHLDQDPDVVDDRRRRFVDLPWSQPHEVHGTTVGIVRHPGDADRLRVDALVTDCPGAVIGIWVGDCAPVALFSESGRIGGAHVGWRGLRDGLVANAVAAMRRDRGERVTAVLGPCIHPCCYEFGVADVEEMERRFGPRARGVTSTGRAALDMPAAIGAALDELDVGVEHRSRCTGCDSETFFFSHRVRGERERQVMAVWKS